MNRTINLLPLLVLLLILTTGTASAEKRFFEMTIEDVRIKVNEELTFTAMAFNGQVPGPLIHVKEGDEVTVKVTNLTSLPHTIHWHGIHMTDNWKNDGVPSVTQEQIKPGDDYTYTFIADPTGSLWYHCHVNVNEHVAYRGMWGPMIVEPKKKAKSIKKVTHDYILMFSAYASAFADRPGYGGMPGDVIDYFALNGRSFPNTQPIRLKKGDVVRLRLYGAGGETHSIHTHGHHFTVTHKDGWPLPKPYKADTISVAPGERYDIVMEANNPGRFIVHDHVDSHVANNGKYPGGPITIFEYETIQRDDDWYVWKNKDYDDNFFYQKSMKEGYGMFNHDGFKGTPIKKERKRKKRN